MDKPFILYDNRFTDATPTATTTAVGFDVAHIADWRTYTFWKGTGAGTNYLTVNCGSSQGANAFAIVGHNLCSVGATVTVEKSADGASWAAASVAITPDSDDTIVTKFESVSAQYWRLKIVSTGAAYIGVAIIGMRMEFPRQVKGGVNFSPYDETIESSSAVSKTGNILGSTISFFPFTCTVKFNRIATDWIIYTYRSFWANHGRLLKPFIWVPALDALPSDIFYARLQAKSAIKTPYDYGVDWVEDFAMELEGANK